jgi:hypothetical protein
LPGVLTVVGVLPLLASSSEVDVRFSGLADFQDSADSGVIKIKGH